jgi:hypothetical protein
LSVDLELLFKKLLRDLRPIFKERGYRSVSQNFVRETPECWVIVNFQKSRWSSQGEKTFYVNAAATAKRLLAFRGEAVDKAPPYFCCEWRCRIEQLGPEREIKQWTITNEESAEQIMQYLQKLFKNFALPALDLMTTETSLLERWGLLNAGYPQLKAKAVLLAADKRQTELRDALAALIERFGGGIVSDGVAEHVRQLRSKYPDVMAGLE